MDLGFSEQIAFHPWVGSRYLFSSPKVLILGESHYEVALHEHSFTTEMIRRQFGEGEDKDQEFERYRFASAVERCFTGKDVLDKDSSREFWNSVSLYNFVQAELPSPKIRPTSKQFADSVKPFCEVTVKLRPELVVVFGTQTWNNLPNEDPLIWRKQEMARATGAPVLGFKRPLELWTGKAMHNGNTHVFWSSYFPHPSARRFGNGRAWNKWKEVLFEEIGLRRPEGSH